MTPHGRKNGMLMMSLGMIDNLDYFGCLTPDEYLQIKSILTAAKNRADESWKEYISDLRKKATANTKRYTCVMCSKPCYLYCETEMGGAMSTPEKCPVDGDEALWEVIGCQEERQ